MISIDLHTVKFAEAEALFIKHINEARMNLTSTQIRFIMGRGILYDAYLQLASDYSLDVIKENYGILIITFE